MFKSNKNQFVKFISIFVTLFFFVNLSPFVNAYVGNTPHDSNISMMMSMLDSIDLPFDPNDYTFLVYVPYGGQDSIVEAMEIILGRPLEQSEIRSYSNPVTATDLSNHDILIVGWNVEGDTGGLDPNTLAYGITGRIVLSGHDLDFHTVENIEAARTMLIQSINYVFQGDGTGLITLGCTSGFPYLPEEWGINVIADGTEDINEFTLEGLVSGIYDGIEPEDLENWGQSYHDTFTIEQGSEFVAFELGGYNGNDIVTVARTSPAIPPGCENLSLSKTEDANDGSCVYPSVEGFPDSYVNYNICYSFGPSCDINDVNIVDYLPGDCDYNDSDPQGYYDPCTHTVRWNFDDLIDANESGCIILKLKVVEDVNQGETLINKAKMYSGSKLIKTAEPVYTEICCETDTIYVKKTAAVGGDGKSWATAFKELNYALTQTTLCTERIFVAKGTYEPTDIYDPYATFQMLDGVDVYGGFSGSDLETEICQRDLTDSNNETILTGDIDNDNQAESYYVITAASSHIDGFTIEKSTTAGIYATNCSPTIANCTIKENNNYGIDCLTDATVNIINTFATNNSQAGIHGWYADSINIDKSTISYNVEYNLWAGHCNVNATDCIFSNAASSNGTGIFAGYSDLTAKNCTISDNSGDAGHGIHCDVSTVDIQKCRIQHNSKYGIYHQYSSGNDIVLKMNIISDNGLAGIYTGGSNSEDDKCQIIDNLIYSNDSNGIYAHGYYYYDFDIRNNTITKNVGYGLYRNGGPEPDVNSNIIYGNTIGGLYGDFTNVHYNCIQGITETYNNINDNPLFYNADANNFHLMNNSPCKDTGNPSFTPDAGAVDIDGEPRKIGSCIDRGCEEYYKAATDFDSDGYTSYKDLDVLCQHWLCSVGGSEPADFDDNNFIDFTDFTVFSESWRWIASWHLDPNIGGQGAYFTTNECLIPVYEEDPNNEPLPPGPTAVYLVYDGNLTPEPNEEITVYVYSDLPLSSMFVELEVSGDANIIAAMDANDCNQFGWESGWWSDPIIDPNGKFADIFGLDGTIETLGNVGYFVIHYYQGEVNIHISSGDAYDVNEQQILTSDEPIIIGAQQQMMMGMPSSGMELRSSSSLMMESVEAVEYVEPEPFDVNETLDWLDEIWASGELDGAMTEAEFEAFRQAIEDCNY